MKASDLNGATAYCVHRVPNTRSWAVGKTMMCSEKLTPDDDGNLRCRRHGFDYNDHRTSVMDDSLKVAP